MSPRSMSQRTLLLAILALVVLGSACAPPAAPAAAPDVTGAYGLTTWEPLPGVPGGAVMWLEGHPSRPGPFAYRIRVPDGHRIPPHTHSVQIHGTVLSGELRFGFGEVEDTAAMQRLLPGAFVAIPANAPHYEEAHGETVLHIEGVGPMSTTMLQ